MDWKRRDRALLFVLLCGAAWSAGCTSSEAYRRSIDERDNQIRALREEKAALKRERQACLGEIDALGAQLAEANARVSAPVDASWAGDARLESLGIGYELRNGMAVITIPSSITFPSGRAELSREGEKALREVAAVLAASHGAGVYHIEGHTDTDPIRKSKFATNRDLSLARATAVLTFLVEACGVRDEQCVVVGYGQYRPLDGSGTAAGKGRDRRVEIVVHASAP